jgi:hypothetical protein
MHAWSLVRSDIMGTLLDLPRQVATALFFAAAIAVSAGALVASQTHRLQPAVHVALASFAAGVASFGYAIWRNHRRRRPRRMFGRTPSLAAGARR